MASRIAPSLPPHRCSGLFSVLTSQASVKGMLSTKMGTSQMAGARVAPRGDSVPVVGMRVAPGTSGQGFGEHWLVGSNRKPPCVKESGKIRSQGVQQLTPELAGKNLRDLKF